MACVAAALWRFPALRKLLMQAALLVTISSMMACAAVLSFSLTYSLTYGLVAELCGIAKGSAAAPLPPAAPVPERVGRRPSVRAGSIAAGASSGELLASLHQRTLPLECQLLRSGWLWQHCLTVS